MNVFLDANILVSVLNKEYPLFPFTSRILSLADQKSRFNIYTSPSCLAIAFYFAEKKTNSQLAKKKIELLCNHILLANNSSQAVLKCIRNPLINDFEDGLQYYAALESNCNCIITENLNDFYFSEIEVINSSTFIQKHVSGN